MPATHSPPNPAEVLQVLLISSLSDNQGPLLHVFDQSNWLLHRVSTCREALTYLSDSDTAVVICERDLPDGDWKLVLNRFDSLPAPPNLIVTSRLANDELWAEVLNLGGYDVLAQPFDAQEVYHVVLLAWHERKRRVRGSAERKSASATAKSKSRATN
jgi:DNA-binding response OmpR family regulator